METFLDRLLDEKDQLSYKIEKLEEFINSNKFQDIAAIQCSLLNIQLDAMKTYKQCLFERILWLQEYED